MFKKVKLFLVLPILFSGLFLFSNKDAAVTNLWIEYVKKQPTTTAYAALVIDAETGEIIYNKNGSESLPVASISKIMTEYIILEALKKGDISWEQAVKVSRKVELLSVAPELANVPLQRNQTYTVRELFEAMSIYSANGATIALAELISGSEEKFVRKMNKISQNFGFNDSHFVNCTGLTDNVARDQNKMSAKDVADLTKILIDRHPEVIKIASAPQATFKSGNMEIEMVNRNEMLNGLHFSYEGMDGLKTGYTDEAGYSFVGTAKRGEKRFISVVLNTADNNERFLETKTLLDYAFEGHN